MLTILFFITSFLHAATALAPLNPTENNNDAPSPPRSILSSGDEMMLRLLMPNEQGVTPISALTHTFQIGFKREELLFRPTTLTDNFLSPCSMTECLYEWASTGSTELIVQIINAYKNIEWDEKRQAFITVRTLDTSAAQTLTKALESPKNTFTQLSFSNKGCANLANRMSVAFKEDVNPELLVLGLLYPYPDPFICPNIQHFYLQKDDVWTLSTSLRAFKKGQFLSEIIFSELDDSTFYDQILASRSANFLDSLLSPDLSFFQTEFAPHMFGSSETNPFLAPSF